MFHGFAFGIIIYSIRNKQMKNKHSQKQNTVTNTSSVMDDVKTICFFLTKDKQDVPTTKVMETNLQSNQMKREQQKLQTVSPSTPKIVVHFQFQERDKRGMNEWTEFQSPFVVKEVKRLQFDKESEGSALSQLTWRYFEGNF